MILTQEVLSDAVRLGEKFITPFNAEALAKVLNVRLIDALRCLDVNDTHFGIGEDGTITLGQAPSADAADLATTATAKDLWDWFLANVAGGDKNKMLAIHSTTELASQIKAPVKWETGVESILVAYLDVDMNGSMATASLQKTFPQLVSQGLSVSRLGTVDGNGTNPDKYVFGVLANDDFVNYFKQSGYHPFRSEWALELMKQQVEKENPAQSEEWVDIDADDAVTVVPIPMPSASTVIESARPPEGDTKATATNQSAEPLGAAPETPAAAEPLGATPASSGVEVGDGGLPAEEGQKKEEPEAKKVKRRSKTELDAERQAWADDLDARGASSELIKKVAPGGGGYKEAEKAYKEADKTLPAASEEVAAPEPAATAPTVTDIKNDIASDAGMMPDAAAPAPAAPAAPAPAAPAPAAPAPAAPAPVGVGAVSSAPAPAAPAPAAPAPAVAPPTTESSVGATGLLDSLLNSTGQ